MNKLTLLILALLVVTMANTIDAQIAPAYNWITTASGPQEEVPYGIATDKYGDNVYLTGKFQSKPLNMGNGITITHTGTKDYFVAKYNHEGVCQWAHEGGNAVTTEGRDVIVDNYGNVIVTGALYGTSVFGGITLIGSGNWDVVTVKYDSLGNVLWAKKGSSYRQDRGNSITIDADGNYLVAGYFGGTNTDTVNFNGYKLTGYGDRDPFIAKYTPAGDLLWVKAAGSSEGSEEAWGVITDANNNVYVTGMFKGTANFGTFQAVSEGGQDCFVTKLNSNGDFLWVKSFGGPGNDAASDIDLLGGNQLIIGGYYTDTVYVNGSMIVGNGDEESFVAKYDLNGNYVDFGSFGSNGADRLFSLNASKTNNIFVGGIFYDTLTVLGTTYVSAGVRDLYVAELNSDFTFKWFKTAGGTDNDYCTDTDIDSIGNVYITGNFNLTANFDGQSITSTGDDELYLAKIGDNEVPVELVSFEAFNAGNGKVNLSWITATETNNSGFVVERSSDNATFAKIGFIEGHGTTTEINNYSFVDQTTESKVYYRLKQIDNDGSFVYSKTVEVNLITPTEFVLEQNFPNPFNPSTTINYQLAKSGFVTLKVYDLLGREIATLVNKAESAGYHSVSFSPSSLVNSGVYFYRISVKDQLSNGIIYTQSNKMMFLK